MYIYIYRDHIKPIIHMKTGSSEPWLAIIPGSISHEVLNQRENKGCNEISYTSFLGHDHQNSRILYTSQNYFYYDVSYFYVPVCYASSL